MSTRVTQRGVTSGVLHNPPPGPTLGHVAYLMDPKAKGVGGGPGSSTEVGRCKLDPGLKAPLFETLIVKKDDSAFNLNPVL